MGLVPKKIDAALRSQSVRLVTEHRSEYSSERALHVQVAESLGISRESVRRWVMQHEVDAGQVAGVSHGRAGGTAQAAGGEQAPARGQRGTEVRDDFFRGGTRPPKPLIVAFADQMRAAGHAVESILTTLKQAGLKIAARTLRAWCALAGPSNQAAGRTVTDALIEDAVRQLAFTSNGAGERVLAPEDPSLGSHHQPPLPLIQVREQHPELHGELISGLIRYAYTT
jgi:hypothetical protein